MHVLSFILLSALAAPPQFDVQLLDGAKISGALTGWNETQIVVETATGRRELETAKVASVAPHNAAKVVAKSAIRVDLSDGSRLAAKEYTTAQGRAKIVLAAGETLEIPTAEVESVRMQDETDGSALEWSRIRAKKIQSDLLVTGNGSAVAGATVIDYHQGAIEDVTDQKVRFVLDGKSLGVKRAKVYGVIYYHPAAGPASEAAFTVADASGSRWSVASLKLDGDQLQLTTAAGRNIVRKLDAIGQIDLSCGKIVYLSDLKPDYERIAASPFMATQRELPGRERMWSVRRDAGIDTPMMATHGEMFRKGLAVHSHTELAWTLPDKYSRLEAIAGIDDFVRPLGAVRLQISGDGKPLFTATISGKDKEPQRISLDLSGVQRLTLVVDSQGNFGVGDHLDLGSMRLIK